MTPSTDTLDADFTLAETAAAIKMSTKWLRARIKAGESGEKSFIAHTRRGNKIMFTAAQVEALRMADAQTPPVEQSVTTGPKRGRK